MSFDEKSRRRDTFDPESVPIEWPGHGTLYLPPPRLSYRRVRGEDGKAHYRQVNTFGPEYDAKVERVRAKDDGSFLEALGELAEDLILRNYDLPPEELDPLLEFTPGPPGTGLPAPWDDVWRVAFGLGPKSRGPGSPPGSSSPESTPTA